MKLPTLFELQQQIADADSAGYLLDLDDPNASIDPANPPIGCKYTLEMTRAEFLQRYPR